RRGRLNGDYTFTVDELLANDPGGAAKLGISGQVFFGDSGTRDQSATGQADYLASHGITKISDAVGGIYSIYSGASGFNYFVQIGNKGTWSEAHVDVAGTPPPPFVPTLLFSDNFDGNAGSSIVHPSIIPRADDGFALYSPSLSMSCDVGHIRSSTDKHR